MHRTAIVLLLLVAACGDDAPDRAAPSPADDVVVVRIERSRFDEPELRLRPGVTVRWVNADAFAHTVTSRDDAPQAFDSGDMGQGDTFEITFEQTGTYGYFCEIHPTMRAVVVVA